MCTHLQKYARVQRLLPGRSRAVDLAEACGRSDVDDVHILVGIRALDVTSTQARTSQCQPSAMYSLFCRGLCVAADPLPVFPPAR